MKKTAKEILVMSAQAIVIGLAFSIAICGGTILMSIVSRNVNKAQTVSVEVQHQKLIDDDDFLFCPYCGEQLKH